MARESSPEPETCAVSCPCGAPLEFKMKTVRPVEVCTECKASLAIVVTVDPQTQKKRVGILVNPDAVIIPPKRGAKPKAPPRAKEESLSGIHNPKCACGARVPVDLRSVDSVYTCTWCGANYTAVAGMGKGSVLPLLMPVDVVPVRSERKTTTRRMMKTTSLPSPLADRTAEAPKDAGTLWAQPVIEREDESVILCRCGEEFAVKKASHKEILTCSGCALTFRLFMAIHPKTKNPMAVMVPRS